MGPIKIKPIRLDKLDEGLRAAREEAASALGVRLIRPFAARVAPDAGSFDCPVRVDLNGALVIAADIAEALGNPDGDGFDDAVLAVAHGIAHSMGKGPAFPAIEEQILEEALAEVLAHEIAPALAEALGGDIDADDLLDDAGDDVVLARPAAAAVAVERFARLAAWLDEADDAEDADFAALTWAVDLKGRDAAARFAALAQAALDLAGDAEKGPDDAAQTMAEYLRGYMRQLGRSAFLSTEALDAALDHAVGVDPDAVGKATAEPEAWFTALAGVEAVTLNLASDRRAVWDALGTADKVDPDVTAAAHRSVDARYYMSTARARDLAS